VNSIVSSSQEIKSQWLQYCHSNVGRILAASACDDLPTLFSKICSGVEVQVKRLGLEIEHHHDTTPNGAPSKQARIIEAKLDRASELIRIPDGITLAIGDHATASRIVTSLSGMPEAITVDLIRVVMRCEGLELTHQFFVRVPNG